MMQGCYLTFGCGNFYAKKHSNKVLPLISARDDTNMPHHTGASLEYR